MAVRKKGNVIRKTIMVWAIGWSCFGLWFTYDSATDTYHKVKDWTVNTVHSVGEALTSFHSIEHK